MDENNRIDFVASHYRAGCFKVEPALRRIRPNGVRWWSPAKVAAAALLVVVVSATATLWIRDSYSIGNSQGVEQTQPEPLAPESIVRTIDFENAPLSVVVAKIKDVYGVEIEDLPENADQMHLSLHYEGSALDLIETINDILGTQMKIAK